MTPAEAGIAQCWKLLFITRIKSVRFVFLELLRTGKKDHSELRFKGRPEDASTRKHSPIRGPHTYLLTITHMYSCMNLRDKKGSYHASVHFCTSDDELSDTQTGRRGLETCVGG